MTSPTARNCDRPIDQAEPECLAELLRRVTKTQAGFLTSNEVKALAEMDRLHPVLVRCGCCRFTAAAQDIHHLASIIERDGQDYIRDFALLASDRAFNEDFRPVNVSPAYQQPQARPAGMKYKPAAAPRFGGLGFTDSRDIEDAHSDADPGL